MIQRIKNSELDNEKIPKILTPIKNHEEANFSKIIVNKPWGYEYLMYSNENTSIWILHIKKDCLTSMHCHLNKKTTLMVLSGEAILTTLNTGYNLKEGDVLIIDKKVFHSTQAISEDGIILMEIETPVKKTDLLRLIDYYGREAKEYESEKEMSRELHNYEYVVFDNKEFGVIKKIGKMNLSIENFENDSEAIIYIDSDNDSINIILNGKIIDDRGNYFEISDIITKNEINNKNLIIKKPLEILRIEKIKKTNSNKIKAILFDFDGVLVDTMKLNFVSWRNAFQKYGITIQREDYFPLEGSKLTEIARIISEKYNLQNVKYKEIIRDKEEYFKVNYTFSTYPGVIEIIDLLKKSGILTAIVSAGYRDRLFSTNPKEFIEKFDYIVTGDEVANGKPNPDPYLKAMEKLNVNPEECIIIENSSLGIESAKSANVFCVGITTTLEKKYLNRADLIIEKFVDLLKVKKIKEIISRT